MIWAVGGVVVLCIGQYVIIDLGIRALLCVAHALFVLSTYKMVSAFEKNCQRSESLPTTPAKVTRGGLSSGVEDPWLDGPG